MFACYGKPGERRRQRRFDCSVFVFFFCVFCFFKCTNGRSSIRCFLPVNSFRTCHLTMPYKCLAFILSYEAHVAQRRGFYTLGDGAGSRGGLLVRWQKVLLVGWRKYLIFTPGPDSESHLICLLASTVVYVSQPLIVIVMLNSIWFI